MLSPLGALPRIGALFVYTATRLAHRALGMPTDALDVDRDNDTETHSFRSLRVAMDLVIGSIGGTIAFYASEIIANLGINYLPITYTTGSIFALAIYRNGETSLRNAWNYFAPHTAVVNAYEELSNFFGLNIPRTLRSLEESQVRDRSALGQLNHGGAVSLTPRELIRSLRGFRSSNNSSSREADLERSPLSNAAATQERQVEPITPETLTYEQVRRTIIHQTETRINKRETTINNIAEKIGQAEIENAAAAKKANDKDFRLRFWRRGL